MIEGTLRVGDHIELRGKEWFIHQSLRGSVVLWPYRPIDGRYAPHALTLTFDQVREGRLIEACPGGLIIAPPIPMEARA
jgi:hypothetical protein